MAGEFELIKQYFKPLSSGLSESEVGIGDDGAVLNLPAGKQQVVVTDTMVCGIHFLEQASAYDLGWKVLAVNLSDLAAMGAEPAFFSLALTMPESDDEWLGEFARGLSDLANKYRISLIGGDTTKGPLTVTVTANGWVDSQKAVLRSGAQVGDVICVTNNIGDGALGLKVALDTLPASTIDGAPQDDLEGLLNALNRPEPQLSVSDLVKSYATSAIDISDGLLADLNHILEASRKQLNLIGLQAQIEVNKIPLSKLANQYVQLADDWSPVLAGGDDYQLCFTIKKKDLETFIHEALAKGVKVSAIGKVMEGEQGVKLLKGGKSFSSDNLKGYLHF